MENNQLRMSLLMLKGQISEMEPDDQQEIKLAVTELKLLLTKYGSHGLMALAIVGAELGIEEQNKNTQ